MRSRWIASLLVAGLAARAGLAGPLDELVMPGPVSEAHAKLEGDCAKCHTPLRPSAQRALCLDCHDEVAADVAAKSGFHGRTASAAAGQCSACHAEHKGRAADVVGLVPEALDHARTDFPLRGAHASAACSACHAPQQKFREAKRECVDCHRKDDRHRGALGTACADCHREDGWRGVQFDHERTRFPLRDAHAKALCAQCHPGERYEDTPRDCVSCHRVDDSHRGTFGSKCESCHGTAGWKRVRFDHARDTRFPLSGSHARAPCLACHVGGVDPDHKPGMDCISCHRGDDDHRGRNGPGCADCHGTTAWKPARFDHGKTKFPLRGEHASVPCAACHTREVHTQKLATQCIACHRSDDPHAGKQGERCERCHSEQGWRERTRFDHELTKFPLLGLHATVACEECHATRAYTGTESRCVACHEAEDVHERTLGLACSRCHNPAGWTAWRFDHATQTDFPLHGLHAQAPCASCHRTATSAESLAKSCSACHAIDDAHRGRFGSDCQRCHVETGWQDVRIR